MGNGRGVGCEVSGNRRACIGLVIGGGIHRGKDGADPRKVWPRERRTFRHEASVSGTELPYFQIALQRADARLVIASSLRLSRRPFHYRTRPRERLFSRRFWFFARLF